MFGFIQPILSPTLALQIFQLLRFGLNFLTAVLLSKLVAPNLLNEYETLLILGATFTFATLNGIAGSFLQKFPTTNSKEQQSQLIVHSFILSVGCGFIASLLILPIAYFSINSIDASHILLWAVYITLNTASILVEYYLLSVGKLIKLILYGGIAWGLQLCVMVLPTWLTASWEISLYLLCILTMFKLGCLIYILCYYLPFKFNYNELKNIIRLFSPLFFATLLTGSCDYLDSWWVRIQFPDEFVLFRYGARELPFTLLLANALSQVAIIQLSKGITMNNLSLELSNLKNRTLKLYHICFPLTILLILFSKELYQFLYASSFIAAAPIFCIYLLLVISRMLFPQSVLLALQKNKLVLRISVIETILHLSFSFIFSYYWGIKGIAYAAVLAYSFDKACLLWFCFKNKIKIQEFTPINWWIFYSILLLITFISV